VSRSPSPTEKHKAINVSITTIVDLLRLVDVSNLLTSVLTIAHGSDDFRLPILDCRLISLEAYWVIIILPIANLQQAIGNALRIGLV
jgi:hypothetical protein